jgi:hypothetical protein
VLVNAENRDGYMSMPNDTEMNGGNATQRSLLSARYRVPANYIMRSTQTFAHRHLTT